MQNLPVTTWFCKDSSGMSHWANVFYFWAKKTGDNGRQTDAERTETESCGNKDLKRACLVSGAGKQSLQNKWEVNTQPQEAINCSGGQLGPSRCSCFGLLWSCLTSFWQSPDLSWGNNGQFHLLSNLKQSIPTGGSLKSFIVLSLSPLTHPHPPKCKSLERTITSSSFYRRGR